MALLEDTRQQMTKMQSNFITMETEWKDEKERLLKQIEEQGEKIKSLEEANTILENSRFEIGLAHSKLAEELEAKNKEILQLQEKIEIITKETVLEPSLVSESNDVKEEKGTLEISNMVELTKKIELLEQINCQMRQTNKELENQLSQMHLEQKTTSSPIKKASPHPVRKGGRNTASKNKSPWSNLSVDSSQQETEKSNVKNETKHEILIQSLNKDILDKEYLLSQKDEVISTLQSLNVEKEATINELQQQIAKQMSDENKVHIGVSTEEVPILNPKILSGILVEENVTSDMLQDDNKTENINTLEEKLKLAQDQIALLNEEIDIANKNMIKVKSNYKIKLKQMQKTIENFSKVSDANTEIVKLNEELHQLSQKVAELEEEKGNLQLHLVDYDSGRCKLY